MSTLSPPALPAAGSPPSPRARDRSRGDASTGHDFAAVLDGHLAASKKPGGAKPAGATRDDREPRDAGKSDPSASAAAAGQTPPATHDVTPTRSAAGPDTTSVATGAPAAPAGGAAAAGGSPAEGQARGEEGRATGPVPGGDAGSSAAGGGPSGETAAAETSLDGTSADAGTGATAEHAAAGIASGHGTAGHGAGDATSTDGAEAGTAVETVTLAEATAATGPAAAQTGRPDTDDEGGRSDSVGQPAAPAGVAAAPPTTKPDGAQGAAPTTAAPATPVVAQVAPAVARVVSRGDGEHRMMLKLHPADLGEIHLTVTVRGEHVDVDIAAGAQARDLLRDGSSHLRSLLESIGRSPGQLVLRDLPSAPTTSPATTAGGGPGADTGSGAASYAGDGTGRGDTGRDHSGSRSGLPQPEPLAARDAAAPRTIRTNGVVGRSALDVTV